MFIVLLRFSDNKAHAGKFMTGHKEWIERGFNQQIFLLTGSLEAKQGGTILAHNISKQELKHFVEEDPFVIENIVRPETIEITPGKTDERLSFLLDSARTSS